MPREKIRNRRKKDKKFEGEVEAERCVSRGGARWTRLNSGGVQAGGVRRGKDSVARCGISRGSMKNQRGQLQEWELTRLLNLEKESRGYFKSTGLE